MPSKDLNFYILKMDLCCLDWYLYAHGAFQKIATVCRFQI